MSEATQMGRILSGYTVCPSCLITNRLQSERMSLSAEYDRVFCFSCLRSSNQIKPAHADVVKALPADYANLVASLLSFQHTQRKSRIIIPYRLMRIWGFNPSTRSEETLSSENKRIKLEFQLDRNKGDDLVELYLSRQSADETSILGLSRVSAPAVNYEIRKNLSSLEIPASRLKALKELISRGFAFKRVDASTCICNVTLIYEGKNEVASDAPEAVLKWYFC